MNRTRKIILWTLLLSTAIGVLTNWSLGISTAGEEGLLRFHARFFGYFTIASNTLAGIMASVLLFAGGGRVRRFVDRPTVQAAVSMYVFFVGFGLWVLLGGPDYASFDSVPDWVADLTTHTFSPILGLVWFLVAVPRGSLGWRDPLRWLVYPALYWTYWIALGSWIGLYPYFFVDFPELGIAGSLRWAGAILVLALVVSYLAVAINSPPQGEMAE